MSAARAASIAGVAALTGGLLGLGLSSVLPAQPSPQQLFADRVGYAPSYAHNVVAAGYWACGELERGWSPAEVIDTATESEAAGDLWARDGAERLVAAAPELLCPEVAR